MEDITEPDMELELTAITERETSDSSRRKKSKQAKLTSFFNAGSFADNIAEEHSREESEDNPSSKKRKKSVQNQNDKKVPGVCLICLRRKLYYHLVTQFGTAVRRHLFRHHKNENQAYVCNNIVEFTDARVNQAIRESGFSCEPIKKKVKTVSDESDIHLPEIICDANDIDDSPFEYDLSSTTTTAVVPIVSEPMTVTVESQPTSNTSAINTYDEEASTAVVPIVSEPMTVSVESQPTSNTSAINTYDDEEASTAVVPIVSEPMTVSVESQPTSNTSSMPVFDDNEASTYSRTPSASTSQTLISNHYTTSSITDSDSIYHKMIRDIHKILVSRDVDEKVKLSSNLNEITVKIISSAKSLPELLNNEHVPFRVDFLSEKDKGVIVMCCSCNEYIKNGKPTKTLINKFGGTFAAGHYITNENYTEFSHGISVMNPMKKQPFFNFKSSIVNHLQSALHSNAVKFEEVKKKNLARSLKVQKNIVTVALLCNEAKMASSHFTNFLSGLNLCEVDIGEIGHSNDVFNDVLRSAVVYIMKSISKTLVAPLPNTQRRRFLYLTTDKGTLARNTLQAVLLIGVHEGEKVVFPIGAPSVYKTKKRVPLSIEDIFDDDAEQFEEFEGFEVLSEERVNCSEIEGGKSIDLAKDIHGLLTSRLDLSSDAIKEQLAAVTVDGAYLNTPFKSEMKKLLSSGENSKFTLPHIWDSGHLLNCAVLDVRDGAPRQNFKESHFFKLFIARANLFAKLFSRGKGYALLKATCENEGAVFRVPQVFASQRFTSSAIQQWMKIYDGYDGLCKSFMSLRRNRTEDEQDQYLLMGSDFVYDLLMMIDLFAPVKTVMMKVQSYKVPAYKIISFCNILIEHLESMDFNDQKHTPLMNSHDAELQLNEFKGIDLLIGYRVTDISTEESVTEELSGSTTRGTIKAVVTEVEKENWVAREKEDCIEEMNVFKQSLISSLKKRLNECVHPVLFTIGKCDLGNLIELLVGENGNYNMRNYTTYGLAEFNEIVTYLGNLKSINDDTSLAMTGEVSPIIFDRIKSALRNVIWGDLFITVGRSMFRIVGGNDQGKLLSEFNSTAEASMVSFQLKQTEEFTLDKLFTFILSNVETSIDVEFVEQNLWKALYTNRELYEAVGVEGSIVLDYMFNVGGSEAIAESYFRVMESQRKHNQHHETVDMRTLVDFCLPEISSCSKAIDSISKIYREGDLPNKVKRHRSNIFYDVQGRASHKYSVSKAVDSHRSKGTGGASYLLD